MEHVAEHNLSYGTVEEFNFRQNIYEVLDAELTQITADHENFTVGHNFMSTWTDAEKKRLNGYVASIFPSEEAVFAEEEVSGLADEVNWTEAGAVTPVKDQGQCGSCWAFSTTGCLEGAHFVASDVLESFSEQQLVDCSHLNHGCNGGSMALALGYFESHFAILEADYPYTSGAVRPPTSTCAYEDKAHTEVKVSAHNNVRKRSVDALMTAVAAGPVSVAIQADQTVFQSYTGGVLDSVACGTQLDHGVLCTGYGTEDGQDYWLVKNSWGASWGDHGYIKIARVAGKGICGIQEGAVAAQSN